jgi:outer membrane protein assembly factor BamA
LRATFPYFVILLSLFGAQAVSAQVTLSIEAVNHAEAARGMRYQKKHAGIPAAKRELADALSYLHHEGYLLARLDTLIQDSARIHARISPGDRFSLAHLRMGNLDPGLASRLGISEKLFFGKPFRYREVARSFERIIRYYENNGYPFASVSLDSVQIEGDRLSASLLVRKNRFYRLDSIKVVGTAKVNSSFLSRYLGLKEAMPYDEEAVAGVSRKVRQLPFVAEKRPPEARLSDRTNRLLLFLDKKEASQFDGIVGVLPDASTGKTTITGDVKLKLVNGLFRNGETLDLEWRRLQSQTQDFSGRFIYPYLFGTPLGSDYALKIYRRDTTFIDINHNIGVQYYFSGLNHLRVFYRERNANLISTSGLENLSTLPEYADVNTRGYGAGVQAELLDYRFNPRKGVALTMSGQAGNRVVRKNPFVNELAYEGLLLRSIQYQIEGNVSAFIPLGGGNVIRTSVQAASVFGNSRVFRNELFRIGGLKTLRGFDEESIFASTYVIPTLEYRFLFSENSNMLLFAEGAWYENTAGEYTNDMPLSFGAGMNFETKAGILSMHYAIGRQQGNDFDVRSGKIHLGLVALF